MGTIVKIVLAVVIGLVGLVVVGVPALILLALAGAAIGLVVGFAGLILGLLAGLLKLAFFVAIPVLLVLWLLRRGARSAGRVGSC